MASQNMDKLPQEMRDEICKKLFDDYSRHDLTALARVSRTWNYTATPFIYRELILNFRDIDSIWAARFLHRIMDPNAQTSNYRLYIRSLRIWMTSPHRSQPRLPLPQNVLTVLGNFVATLPRLEVFEWSVPEPMPATLLAAIPHRPGPRIQSTLVSLWGLDEELRFIENLEQETIAKLEIEYRPGRHVGRNRLAEISHYLKRLLTGLVGLNTLMIDFSCGPRHRFIDLVQMDVQELLPPVENLGLDHCHCGSVRQGIQVHIRWGSLRRLSLRSCKGTSYLFREARGNRVQHLSALIILSPLWNRNTFDRHRLQLARFLRDQSRLEVLELEAPGLSMPIIYDFIRNSGSSNSLTELRLHGVEDRVYSEDINTGVNPIKRFRSIDTRILRNMGTSYPHLVKLCIELTQQDIKLTSNALHELSLFQSLRHLEITTLYNTHGTGPHGRPVTMNHVVNVANAVWSSRLKSFRLRVKSFDGNQSERRETKRWLTKCSTTGIMTTTDEIETDELRWRRVWTRILGVPNEKPDDAEEGSKWLNGLMKGVEQAGKEALKALR